MKIKNLILTMMACLPIAVFAQGKYHIDGQVSNSYNAPAKVYLEYNLKGKTNIDSVVVKNGRFQFDGAAQADPIMGYLILNKKGTGTSSNDNKSVYLENGNISVTSADSLGSAKVDGTKTNIENTKYDLATKPVNAAYDSLDKKQSTATDEEKKSEAFDRAGYKAEKEIGAMESAINKKFIQENPDSYVSLVALENYAYGADYVDIAPLFDGLSASIKGTEEGKKFAARLPKIKAVQLGAVAPGFAEADTSGKMIDLTAFRGKYVLVDFWASWCGPCRHESPYVVKAFKRFSGKDFTILGVSLDKSTGKDRWLKAIHKDGLTWTQVSDLQFWNNKAAVLYGVNGIPQNFLLDPNGKIIAKNLREYDLEDKLEEIFGKI